MHVNKHCFIFSALWYLHLKEQQVPLRRFQTGFVGHNHVWPATLIAAAQQSAWRRIRNTESFFSITRGLPELRISSPFVVQPDMRNSRSKLHSQHLMWHHLHICGTHGRKEGYESSPALTQVEPRPETKVGEKASCYLQLIISVFTTT